MAGANIAIQLEVDDRNVRQFLNRLVGRSEDLTPVMSAIGQDLVYATWRRFEAEKGPDGTSWSRSSDSYKIHRAGGTEGNTLRRRGRDGQVVLRAGFLRRLAQHKTLTATSRLKDSITFQADANSVTVGTNMVYGAIHQLGGVIKPVKGRFLRFEIDGRIIFAKQVTIPARPYLGIDDADERSIGEIIGSYLS